MAISNSYVINKVYSSYSFDNVVLFDAFIKKVCLLRINANDPLLSNYYKKLMNSLYGRFACIYHIFETPYQHLEDYHLTLLKRKYNHIPIASAITSYGRLYVYSLIKDYIGNVLYWDTDGIFMNKKTLLSSKELGQFRLISTNKNAYFIATKFYFYKPIEYLHVQRCYSI